MAKTLSLNKKLSLTLVLCALVVILGLPPTHFGMIPISENASVTIMHIPVLLAVMLIAIGDKKSDVHALLSGIIVGAVFGIFSLILSIVQPSGVLDPLFKNPCISILPRILLGIISWLLWNFFANTLSLHKITSAALTAFLATLFHTASVIGSLYILAASQAKSVMGNSSYSAVMKSLLPNAASESIAATIICTITIGAIILSTEKKSKLYERKHHK